MFETALLLVRILHFLVDKVLSSQPLLTDSLQFMLHSFITV